MPGPDVSERMRNEGLPLSFPFLPFPSLTLEERTRFSECFSGLGRLEAEQECRRLELYQAQFQAALQEGEAAARTQSMLSHKLGLAAGLAAAILLG